MAQPTEVGRQLQCEPSSLLNTCTCLGPPGFTAQATPTACPGPAASCAGVAGSCAVARRRKPRRSPQEPAVAASHRQVEQGEGARTQHTNERRLPTPGGSSCSVMGSILRGTHGMGSVKVEPPSGMVCHTHRRKWLSWEPKCDKAWADEDGAAPVLVTLSSQGGGATQLASPYAPQP